MNDLDKPECPMKGCQGHGHNLGNFAKHSYGEACPWSGKFNEKNNLSWDICLSPKCDKSSKSMHSFHRTLLHCSKERINSEGFRTSSEEFGRCNIAPTNNRKSKRMEPFPSRPSKKLNSLNESRHVNDLKSDQDLLHDSNVKGVNKKEHLCYQFQLLTCDLRSSSIDFAVEQKNQQELELERLSKEFDKLQEQELDLAKTMAEKHNYLQNLKQNKFVIEETYNRYYSLLVEVAKKLNLFCSKDSTELDNLLNKFERVQDGELYTEIQHLLETNLNKKKKFDKNCS